MKFAKYHGLGNDYIVIDPNAAGNKLDPATVRVICHRNYGVGSDGILLGPCHSRRCDWKVTILNPDGSEAEKSGNGLRIFARYLYDQGKVGDQRFSVETAGGPVTCQVLDSGRQVRVEMGKVSFHSRAIPVKGPDREVLDEPLEIAGKQLRYCAATVGNPHCVVLNTTPTAEQARQLGPLIENHKLFPNRTNVQFVQVLDRSSIRIEIWERGAGYTLASGSSATAAAAVAARLGNCDLNVAVSMPGGKLDIELDDDFRAALTGPVTRICSGKIDMEMMSVNTADG